MADQAVKTEIKDRICLLTLNRPEKLNALTDEMAKDFRETIERLKIDSEPRVMVITGAGRAFSAGGNLDKIQESIGGNPIARKKESFAFYRSFLRIMSLDIPTIAAINGHAIGAGACLPMACDMRLASSDAKIGFTFIKIGLHPGMGAEYFLNRIIGRARTFELLMTGDVITAEEAYRIGLINHITTPEELMDRAMELARKIASMPALPIKMMKESIEAAMYGGLLDTLNRQAAYQAICYMGDDIKEGVDSVREKRIAIFKDEY